LYTERKQLGLGIKKENIEFDYEKYQKCARKACELQQKLHENLMDSEKKEEVQKLLERTEERLKRMTKKYQ